MHIVHIVTRLNVGGVAKAITTLIPYLDGRQTLVYGRVEGSEGDASYLTDKLACETIHIRHLCRSISPKDDLYAYGSLISLLKRLKPDVVHTHLSKAGLLGRSAAWTVGIRRTVHTYHGNVFEGHLGRVESSIFKGVESWFARRTSHLIAVSETLKDRLMRLLGCKGRWSVVPPPILLSTHERRVNRVRAKESYRIDGGNRVLGFLARLAAVKRPVFLVDVLKELAEDWILLVGGGGALEGRMRSSALKAGLSSRIRFIGWVRDISNFYAATDVFALASITEGFPLGLVEALYMGVPVVALPATGVVDILNAPLCSHKNHLRTEGGYVVYSGRPYDFAECVEQAYKEMDSLDVKAASEPIIRSCSPERVAERYNSIYSELMREAF